MRIWQLNLNHCKEAQDLVWQTSAELRLDVAILSEQYENIDAHNWIADETSKAAILSFGGHMPQTKMARAEKGFTWVKVEGIYLFSCYAPPSLSDDQFERMMTALVEEAIGKHPLLIAGDFNAWSTTWGSSRNNRRGKILLESLAPLDLELLNEPGVYTYEKGNGKSIIDLSFAERDIARRAKWSLSDAYTHSDHNAILIGITGQKVPRSRLVQKAQQRGWRKQRFDEPIFNTIWNEAVIPQTSAIQMASQVTTAIANACDASMPRRYNRTTRTPAYWWNDDTAAARKECIKARRKVKRARHQPTVASLRTELRKCKAAFKAAVKASKRECFKKLRDSAEEDPWGKAYKMVMKTVKGPRAPQPVCQMFMEKVVTTLFPAQEAFMNDVAEDHQPIPLVSAEEVLTSLDRIEDNKAPGLDGVPNIALKTAVKARPNVFAALFNSCLLEGVFPDEWKKQRLVLLLKPGKLPDQPSSYRPLCMLDTIGKMLERIVCNRIQNFLEKPDGLSPNQFGFRKARSTVDAISTVMGIAQEATRCRSWRSGNYCAIVTLDIKNAFNSANWSQIMGALAAFKVPAYLQRMIGDYFNNRLLLYDTEDGVRQYKVTGGVPQGSVLGPTLWNVMYDGVLKMALPAGAILVGYADDIALVVVDKRLEPLTAICNDAISRIRKWLIAANLELAAKKTEVVLLSTKRARKEIAITVGEHSIRSQPHLKYLGVIIDSRMTFKDHCAAVSKKAQLVHRALSRLMPNIGGPREEKRQLLSLVTTSVITYAAPIWANAKKSHIKEIRTTYRLSALRVASAYRTVSDDAIAVISRKIPIDLLAKELQRLYLVRGMPLGVIKEEERQRTLIEWQQRWDLSTKGRWTHKLIPDIAKWYRRKHGEVDFYVTQLLSGHGCFKEYLYRFNLENDPFCPACPGELESARHVLFLCPRFETEREDLRRSFGEHPSETNLTTQMCDKPAKWRILSGVAARIMKTLRDEEWTRKANLRHQQLNLQADGDVEESLQDEQQTDSRTDKD